MGSGRVSEFRIRCSSMDIVDRLRKWSFVGWVKEPVSMDMLEAAEEIENLRKKLDMKKYEELLTQNTQPQYRILVEEKMDGGLGHRLYWEWCGEDGMATAKQNGKWEFFADVFIGSKATNRIGRCPGDLAFSKLRECVEAYLEFNDA